jgi:chromosome partitioning protein
MSRAREFDVPVISFVSPKGGVGKTTSAQLLATELAQHADHVTVIDADPNLPINKWAQLPGKPANVHVIADTGESTLVDSVDEARANSPFVIVDLEGAASARVTNAIAMSDLVLIPIQGSVLDADQAARAIKLIRTTGKSVNRFIAHAILFNRVPAAMTIRTRNFRAINAQFAEAGIPAMHTALADREAYRSLFTHGGTLADLDPKLTSSLPAARANAEQFAAEVIHIMKQGRAAA